MLELLLMFLVLDGLGFAFLRGRWERRRRWDGEGEERKKRGEEKEEER